MNRPDVDEYFMQMVELVSYRTTCLRRRVGAVLVKDGHVISTGYNGAPKGLKHCAEIGCIREQMKIPSGERHELCRAVHAEQNAVVQAAYHGISTKDSTIYTNCIPCVQCAKILINAGIKEIVYEDDTYNDPLSKEILKESNMIMRKYESKKNIPFYHNESDCRLCNPKLWNTIQFSAFRSGKYFHICPICNKEFEMSSYRFNCCGKQCEDEYEKRYGGI